MASYRLDQLESYRKLRHFALNPPSLPSLSYTFPKRLEQFCLSVPPFKLFYSFERVDECILDCLYDLADEAELYKKMHAMQHGEVVNHTENRAALHTAMRDFFDEPKNGPIALQAAQLAFRELEKLKAFLQVNEAKYTHFVQVGIGGSFLGTQAAYLALELWRKKDRFVHFLANVDPDEASAILDSLPIDKTLFAIVSKSGSTLETEANRAFITDILEAKGLVPKEHLISITTENSALDSIADFTERFYFGDYVGGRYSVTSMVGLVALAFAYGMDRSLEFLRGANHMDKIALRKDPRENLPLLSSLLTFWNRNCLDLPTEAIIPYSQALSRLPAHLQQLFMESDGKQLLAGGGIAEWPTCPIFWGEVGTNSQHSFFQFLHQSASIVPIEFIGFMQSQRKEDVIFQKTSSQEKLLANLFAQAIALSQGKQEGGETHAFSGNRPTRMLFAEKLDAFTLGALISYYEHKAAYLGWLWGINPFDQPGVELGKHLSKKYLEQFAKIRDGADLDQIEEPFKSFWKKVSDFR